jgi:hypothetical protein
MYGWRVAIKTGFSISLPLATHELRRVPGDYLIRQSAGISSGNQSWRSGQPRLFAFANLVRLADLHVVDVPAVADIACPLKYPEANHDVLSYKRRQRELLEEPGAVVGAPRMH